jgi:hypothetical protein
MKVGVIVIIIFQHTFFGLRSLHTIIVQSYIALNIYYFNLLFDYYNLL